MFFQDKLSEDKKKCYLSFIQLKYKDIDDGFYPKDRTIDNQIFIFQLPVTLSVGMEMDIMKDMEANLLRNNVLQKPRNK